NKTRDYAPYQKLMDVIYNALNPALQTPYAPPPKPHHESFWDELIIGLLAIVVMVIATPAIDLLPVQLIRRHVSSNFLSVICGDSISRSHKESFSLNDKRFNGVI
ncbi:MAG: hypothetical protein NTZ67_04200, partial [Gammaproteobacteria bacterium]|nr:hypothetical protein [Gammaproteobacteria bacterium]